MMIDAQAVEAFVQQAYQVGLDQEQLRRFAAFGYVPQPKQMQFHAYAREADSYELMPEGPPMIGQGGARGGAKSHAALTQVALDDCMRVDGLKALYLRSVGKSARESFEDFLQKALPAIMQYYLPSKSKIALPNGSQILLGGFRTEKDIDQYIGLEYDIILMDDCQLVPYERRKKLFASMRTSKPDWRPRGYLTFNPSGVGHAQLKREFVLPWRAAQQESRPQSGPTRFIFSLPEDNRFLNPDYVAYLDTLTGWLHKAWRLGDFDIAAGQYFIHWSHKHHVIHELPLVDGRIPADWEIWASLDYGWNHPTVVQVHCKDGDGRIYTFAEHWQRRWRVEQHAEAIKSMLEQWGLSLSRLRSFVAGHDVFAKQANGTTIAMDYAEQGIHLERANVDRVNGWANMVRLLGAPEEGKEAGWQVLASCTHLIEQIPMMEHDPKRPEDVLKVDVDADGLGGDDSGDCARYGLMAESSGIKVQENPFYD